MQSLHNSAQSLIAPKFLKFTETEPEISLKTGVVPGDAGGNEVGGVRADPGPPLPLLRVLRGRPARLLHPVPAALRLLPQQVIRRHRG